jgi:hypothetical protein
MNQSSLPLGQATGQDNSDLHELATLLPAPLAVAKQRICAQFEMARGRSLGTALDHIEHRPGCGLELALAMTALNKAHDLRMSFGEYVIRSEEEQGYWCNGFGWAREPVAASGYTWARPLAGFPQDAQFVGWQDARAFEQSPPRSQLGLTSKKSFFG